MVEEEEEVISENIILDEDDLFALEQDEDDGFISGDLSEEASEGFIVQCHLDGFSFPGDEKDGFSSEYERHERDWN